jgi:Bcr/CflA subfamily drug resistance transporter
MTQRTIQLIMVITASVLALVATDIILPSLPGIARSFSIPSGDAKLLLSGFMIGQFATALFWGIVADQLGRRNALLLGMLVFLLGSLLSIQANSIELLIASRFLQGAGAIVAPVAGWALIQDLYPKDEGVRILNWVGSLTAIIPLFAPVLGGALDLLYGWRINFYCITAYSLVFCFIFSCLTKTGLVVNKPPKHSLQERLQTYRRIISNKTFVSYIALFGLLNCGEWCFLTIAPFYYEDKQVQTHIMGILLMCTSMGFVFGALLASRLTNLWGVDKTINAGIQLALASSALLLLGEYVNWSSYQLINALVLGLYIASSALLWGATTSRALQCFDECRGAASAIRSLVLLTFSSFGTYVGRYIDHHHLYSIGFFLLFMALCALVVFNNKEFKTERLSTNTAY